MLNDFSIGTTALLFSVPLILFLLFNFPFGRIFIGDLGAYFYGFVTSILVICLFGKHNYQLTWLAIIILFYPSMELLFSFIRKVKNNMSPLEPDRKHLHTLVFLNISKKRKNISVPFAHFWTIIYLLLFWSFPIIINFINLNSLQSILLLLIFTSIGYYLMYRYYIKHNKKGD